jgi:hypothetical protein
VRAVIDGRSTEQFESFGAVEDPDNEEVREAFDVGEAVCELREDFEEAFSFVLGAWTFGDLLGVVVWTFYVSDGLGRKHGGPSLSMGMKLVAFNANRSSQSFSLFARACPRRDLARVAFWSARDPFDCAGSSLRLKSGYAQNDARADRTLYFRTKPKNFTRVMTKL